ncbi:MAG: tripartite tricarboxylate transporter substrate binding protein [Variibacter sp.]|nr:tripartite tricarboxylate transporter substrate binding protein [Variibacter sp.]
MTGLSRRAILAGAAAMPFVAHAQNAPVIKIVVPFPPGGSVDPIARMAQPGLQQRLGATIVIENKAGASGSIGAAQVAKSPPDGNTWLFVFDSHAVNPALMTLPFDSEKDLEPVLLIGTAPYILAKHPSRPWKNFAEYVAAAKAKPDSLSFATVGSGSIGHLAMAQLSKRAGIKLIHTPYRGGGPAMNDAIAGHVDSIIGSAALATTQLKAGKIEGLLNTGAKRLANLPDIPTAAESGFPGFEANAWWGVFAPGGTPKPIVERFASELTAVLREERVARQLTDALQIELRLGGPEELRRFFGEQMKQWGALIREEGIKGDG